jgi:hypothetical protein
MEFLVISMKMTAESKGIFGGQVIAGESNTYFHWPHQTTESNPI